MPWCAAPALLLPAAKPLNKASAFPTCGPREACFNDQRVVLFAAHNHTKARGTNALVEEAGEARSQAEAIKHGAVSCSVSKTTVEIQAAGVDAVTRR
jgi:hypothetical protein